MRTCCFLAALALTLSFGTAQEPPLPPAVPAPALVLDPGGPAAPFRDEALFGQGGLVTRTALLTAEQKRDVGVVYLFDPANPAGGKVIRGTAGAVRAAVFVRPDPAGGPVLVTAGREWTADGKQV